MANKAIFALAVAILNTYKRKQYPDVPEYAIARMVKVDMERG